MNLKYRRLKYILFSLTLAILGLWLIIKNFNENIVFFFTPSELTQKNIGDKIIRVGGLVTQDSVMKDGKNIQFIITDTQNELVVRYTGLLPNLFREGQGIVAKGKLINQIFIADELLAKHDENYMPKEVASALKKSGNWKAKEGK